ncbi:MAG TPA: S41 family peptidase [Bryobacteraceae bacterium]|nr:S41 family peptidase [Bryobacteraceae bacterium]
MARKRRPLFLLPLVIVACSVLGGLYGPRAHVAAAGLAPEADQVPHLPKDKEMSLFARALVAVEQNAAEPLDFDTAIYKGAIPGMMHMLDPHSNFFDPKEYSLFREDQTGHYFGVGMEVTQRNGKTVVVAPYPGSPAWKVGLRPGDIITAVNDKSTENLNTTEVADLLKGPRGTQVKVVVSREGAPDYLSFTVIREEISRKSVQEAFWLQPGIAYVKILSFGETTGQELDQTLKQLGENNRDGSGDAIKGLVLDLRGNPGGLLDTGVEVADHFLPKGSLIVSHRGRSSAEKAYVAYNGNHGRNYPMVVLVDRLSASAAEIVSGALQDHDRAWILGETTFGKGLVQTVYPLAEHTALALTTAHFYTPSGRLIQRDYSSESFYDYYTQRDENVKNPADVKMTDSGRTVYGGGGITPDQVYKTPPLDSLQSQLLRNGLFTFTRTYFAGRSSTLPKGWMPDEETLSELHDYLVKNNYTFTEIEWAQDQDWIKRYLAREMYVWAFNKDESDRMFARTDPEVEQAVDALPKAEALVENARKVIVQRMSPDKARR